MATLSPSILLDTWDAGVRRHPIDRALLLLALAEDGSESLPDVPLGTRNRLLMRLRRARFGDALSIWVDCEACGDRMSLELQAGDLPDPPEGAAEVEIDGHRFRRPTSRDLAGIAAAPNAGAAARLLLRACATTPETLPRGDAFETLLPRVEAALDEADPWADLTLLADCPACGARQDVALDVPGLLWDEIAAAAQRLMDDVHAIAGAYGWTEREILRLSDARRAAYLSRVEA
jgi:hypothetical protein